MQPKNLKQSQQQLLHKFQSMMTNYASAQQSFFATQTNVILKPKTVCLKWWKCSSWWTKVLLQETAQNLLCPRKLRKWQSWLMDSNHRDMSPQHTPKGMEHLVIQPNAARPTPTRAVNRTKMSSVDFSVGLPAEEPHGLDILRPPHLPPSLPMTTQQSQHHDMPATSQHVTPPLPSYTTTYADNSSPLYSSMPPPPPPPHIIHIMFNNINALPVEDDALLAKH